MGDAAGAEGDDDLIGVGFGDEGGDGKRDAWGVGYFAGVGALDSFGEGMAGDAGDGIFAGGVDVEDLEGVGIVEGGGELGEEIARAGVAVGLEEQMDAGVATVARRS